MGGSTAILPELARMARLETSFSGMVSFAMRSLEGELLARLMSCTSQLPRQDGKQTSHDDLLMDVSIACRVMLLLGTHACQSPLAWRSAHKGCDACAEEDCLQVSPEIVIMES